MTSLQTKLKAKSEENEKLSTQLDEIKQMCQKLQSASPTVETLIPELIVEIQKSALLKFQKETEDQKAKEAKNLQLITDHNKKLTDADENLNLEKD